LGQSSVHVKNRCLHRYHVCKIPRLRPLSHRAGEKVRTQSCLPKLSSDICLLYVVLRMQTCCSGVCRTYSKPQLQDVDSPCTIPADRCTLTTAEPPGLPFVFVEIYCVITAALWSRGGSAVVSVHPPAASICGFV